MTLVLDDAFLPAILSAHPMTDEEFTAFCSEHPDLNFEMTAEGELIAMAPTHSDTGASNFEIAGELRAWARRDRRGIGCDSSTGFVLPNGARRSPDASWTLKSRVQQLGTGKRKSFWHLCPDFVIEVRSSSACLHKSEYSLFLVSVRSVTVADRKGLPVKRRSPALAHGLCRVRRRRCLNTSPKGHNWVG